MSHNPASNPEIAVDVSEQNGKVSDESASPTESTKSEQPSPTDSIAAKGEKDGRGYPRRKRFEMEQRIPLAKLIELLTHPVTGAFPAGITPKQLNSHMETMPEALRPSRSKNHLQVLLWRDLNAGHIQRVNTGMYVAANSSLLNNVAPHDAQKPKRGRKRRGPNGQGTSEQGFSAADLVAPDDQKVKQNGRKSKRKRTQKSLGPEFVTFSSQKVTFVCDHCLLQRRKNKAGRIETLLICHACKAKAHPACLNYTAEQADRITRTVWQCRACKTCTACNQASNAEGELVLCDSCDRAYHAKCHQPALGEGLKKAEWICSACEQDNQHQMMIDSLKEKAEQYSRQNADPVTKPVKQRATPMAPKPAVVASVLPMLHPSTNGSLLIPMTSASFGDSVPTSVTTMIPSSIFPASVTGQVPQLPPGLFPHQDSGGAVDASLISLSPAAMRSALLGGGGNTVFTAPKLNQIMPNAASLLPTAVIPAPQGQVAKGMAPPLATPMTSVLANQNSVSSSSGDVSNESSCLVDESTSTSQQNTGPDLPLSLDAYKSLCMALLQPPDGISDKLNKCGLNCWQDQEMTNLAMRDQHEFFAEAAKAAPSWTSANVADFLRKCGFYRESELFEEQEIDGPSLLLLRRSDVLQLMGLKLGPGLKIFHRINKLQKLLLSKTNSASAEC